MNEIVSPIQNISYTERDFVSTYTQLLDLTKELTSKWDPSISNESDPGVVLLKLNAVIADKCNYAIDKNILECFPISVTQQQNALKLFEQLGYYMHWYKSSMTDVYIKWIAEPINHIFTIDAFTTVSDIDGSIIYTLLGPSTGYIGDNINISSQELDLSNNSNVVFRAIQGTPEKYKINGSTTITSNMLDADNRLYFDTNYIAENGIFICNVGQLNYNSWKKKNNLLIENLGNTYYKFGVSSNGKNCYLEFPIDAESIFQQGIEITYIKTDGFQGNINSSFIKKFYNDVSIQSDANQEPIQITPDNMLVTNYFDSVDGVNYESINDAYLGYKRTVGTFDTLVTLRDYINYIINSGLVSNDFICDRNNDIQLSYKILTSINDVDHMQTCQEEDNELDAFSMKLYCLRSTSENTNDINAYIKSFDLLNNDELIAVKNYLETSKSLQHEFAKILPATSTNPRVCMLKNVCPISFKIIPQVTLTKVNMLDIQNAIKTALYNQFMSKKLAFGEEIAYDLVYNTILNADSRIKNVILDNIVYVTYGVYYDDTVQIVYNSNDQKWYDPDFNVINPADYGLNPVSSPAKLPGVFYTVRLDDDDVQVSTNTDRLSYYTKNKNVIKNIAVNAQTYYSMRSTNPGDEYVPITFVYNTNHWELNGSTVSLSDYGISLTGVTPQTNDKIRIRMSYAHQLRTDIFAKSVLAGKTPFYVDDEEFDYNLNSNFTYSYEDVERIDTNVNITLATATREPSTYTLRNNEYIQFFAPNLLAGDTYSSFVRFEYHINNAVSKGASYTLNDNEFIAFYWKDADSDLVYKYKIYGYGSIICPTFTLSNSSETVNTAAYHGQLLHIDDATGHIINSSYLDMVMSENAAREVQNRLSGTENKLTASKTITIKHQNSITINDASQCSIYWILKNSVNSATGSRYVLFNKDDTQPKILDTGEYLFVTNAAKTDYTVFGAGTMISRSAYNTTWSVPVIDANDLLTNGIVNYVEKFIAVPTGVTLTATENKFMSIGSGCTLKIMPGPSVTSGYSVEFTNAGVSITPSTYTLADFSISYALPNSSEFIPFEEINLQGITWNARSKLALVMSKEQEQILLQGQSITYYTADDESGTTISGADHVNASVSQSFVVPGYYPVCLRSSMLLSSTSTTTYVYDLDNNGELVYTTLYQFRKLDNIEDAPTTSNGSVTFTSNGSAVVVLKPTESNIGMMRIPVKLPNGNYILCLKNYNEGLTSLTISLDGTPLQKMNYAESECKDPGTYYLNVVINDAVPTQHYLLIETDRQMFNCTVEIENIKKYVITNELDAFNQQCVLKRMIELDYDNIFKYNVDIDENQLINNPLLSKEFLNHNHIYNEFTICELGNIFGTFV